jgi:hypothetical protein
MSNIQIILVLSDDSLVDEDLQHETEKLLEEIRNETEIDDASLILAETSEKGEKTAGGFFLGKIKAIVKPDNYKQLLSFLSSRLIGRVIEMEVKVNGKTLIVKANNQDELLAAVKAAQEFVKK